VKLERLILLLLTVTGSAASQGTMAQPRAVLAQWANYYALRYQVPVELVKAIIEEESQWNPYAVSPKGAVGVMQLMPGTAQRFGVRNRFRGDDNIRGGVAYLAWLMRQFRGDLRLVTAAYYVGEATIRARGLEYSSADVHGYVERVATRYRIATASKRPLLLSGGGEG
jgi:soluble lytic murein transglycosylase-like protein